MKHFGKLVYSFVVCLALFWSCTDDISFSNLTTTDSRIKFATALSEPDDNIQSRSGRSGYSDFRAEKFADQELYLVSAVSSGIDATRLSSYESPTTAIDFEDGPISRGTVTTNDNLGTLYSGKHVKMFAYAYTAQTAYNSKDLSTYTFADVISSGVNITKYIDDEDLTISSTANADGTYNLTTTSTRYYWLTNDYRMTFFAVFPSKKDYRPTSSNYTITDTGNEPKLYYKIEDNVADQQDFLYAQTQCGGIGSGSTDDTTVHFKMKHIMAGVSVTLGDGFDLTNDVITAVTFSNINVAGTFNLASGEWDTSSFTTGNNTFSCTAANGTSALNNDNGHLFLVIPNESLGSTATLAFTITNKSTGATTSYTTTIAGHKWEMGKTLNYQISTDPSITKYYLSTEYDTMYFSWAGSAAGSGTATPNGVSDYGMLRIKSWKEVTDASGTSYTAMPWTTSVTSGSSYLHSYAASSTDMGLTSGSADAKDYATTYSADDEDYGFEQQEYNFYMKPTLTKATPTVTDSEEAATISSQAGTLITGNTYYDLTKYKQAGSTGNLSTWTSAGLSNGTTASGTKTNSRCSSNCYMIEYPGYYKIPCVYGNSLYADAQYKGAYIYSSSTSTYALATLQSAKNNSASTMGTNWINSGTDRAPAGAELIWQDAPGLISSVSTSGSSSGEYFVQFYISSTGIKPGNAVIAVVDGSGVPIWSWHIWVTPHAYDASNNNRFSYDPNTLSGLSTQSMLKVPLGFVQGNANLYPERQATIVLTQGTSGKTATVNLIQRKHTFQSNSCCYYQWGRKDPFPGMDAEETGEMAYDGSYTTTNVARKIYNISNTEVSITNSTALRTIYDCIANPATFYCKASNGTSRIPSAYNYYNLWGCSELNTGTTIENGELELPVSWGTSGRKMAYDPCPPGYRVPPVLYLPAMTYDGRNHGTFASGKWVSTPSTEADMYGKEVNTPYTNYMDFLESGGFDFYRSKMASYGTKNTGAGTYRMYAMGFIASDDGSYLGYGHYARYQTCSAWVNSSDNIYQHRMFSAYFYYSGNDSSIHVADGNTECYGVPVMALVDTNFPVY
jgi:hypothetical protein